MWCHDALTEVRSRCCAITEQGARVPSGWHLRRSVPELVTLAWPLGLTKSNRGRRGIPGGEKRDHSLGEERRLSAECRLRREPTGRAGLAGEFAFRSCESQGAGEKPRYMRAVRKHPSHTCLCFSHSPWLDAFWTALCIWG